MRETGKYICINTHKIIHKYEGNENKSKLTCFVKDCLKYVPEVHTYVVNKEKFNMNFYLFVGFFFFPNVN